MLLNHRADISTCCLSIVSYYLCLLPFILYGIFIIINTGAYAQSYTAYSPENKILSTVSFPEGGHESIDYDAIVSTLGVKEHVIVRLNSPFCLLTLFFII